MSEGIDTIDLTQPIQIGYESFPSREEAKDYFSSFIREIGCCDSLKQKNETAFYLVVDLLKRHPNRVKKGLVNDQGECQIIDICIGHTSTTVNEVERDALYVGAIVNSEAYSLRGERKKLKVTWTKCLVPRSEGFFFRLREAMRYEIQPQIEYFQQVFQTVKQCSQVLSIMGSRCIHCMSDRDIDLVEAEYSELFVVLAEQFVLQLEPSELPSEFHMCPFTFWNKLTDEDSDSSFRKRWTDYFFTHAKPRWVCRRCLHDPTLYSLVN